MKRNSDHANDGQLRVLLFEQEDNQETVDIAQHVEACETCQIRLTELVNENSVELEASQLLSGYVESDRSLSDVLRSTQASVEVEADFDRVLLDPPSHPEMLGRIGRYEIERRIGSGGMGVVFKAIDTELNRPVAIKVLAPHLSRNGAARQRFSRESRAAAAVVHEHVVSIHNVDASAQHPYLVMQYVSGESLQSRIDREGPLSVERILRIGIQTALGLSAAHQQGIVHRDIKPANILLEDGVDRLLITDFGLARTVDDASLTHTGVVAGTPNYMSPEQANGDEVDHRSDLFSLGSVLYFAATGHTPFRAERAMGVLHRICRERHRPVWQVNAAIPDELSAVIDQLLEKRAAKRYASAAAVADSLSRILQNVLNRRPSMSTRLRSWGRRHQVVARWTALVTIAATGLVAWFAFSHSSHSRLTFGLESNSATLIDDSFHAKSTEQSAAAPQTDGGYPSPTISGANTMDAVTADRLEFYRNLNSVQASLAELGNNGSTSEQDSFSDFRHDLKLIERRLQAIDPTLK